MYNKKDYNNIANKLAIIEDKFLEIKKISNVIEIWVKNNDYELIPIVNMLNEKMSSMAEIFNNL